MVKEQPQRDDSTLTMLTLQPDRKISKHQGTRNNHKPITANHNKQTQPVLTSTDHRLTLTQKIRVTPRRFSVDAEPMAAMALAAILM